ncbi:histidine kinase group protein [Purpureocillium lavendulum]|uniref:Histidine kinase group protein n=1 Tax=Purpureocillium lavendulum TaxID=1247861 RepID=A0AB34FIE9_9HYPO|nr:histidine kinase group protein [Purpureocillium lavendulum]
MSHSDSASEGESSGAQEPVDPTELFKAEFRRKAEADGLSPVEAEMLASIALESLRLKVVNKRSASPVTKLEVATAVHEYTVEEVEKNDAEKQALLAQGMGIIGRMTDEEFDHFMGDGVDGESDDSDDDDDDEDDDVCAIGTENHGELGRVNKRFVFFDDGLEEVFGSDDDSHSLTADMANLQLCMRHEGMDLITALCQRVDLAVEVAKYLRPEDLLTLYSVSRSFHSAFNAHALSVIRQIIAHAAPEAGRVFAFKMYKRHLMPDPCGRSWGFQMSEQERRTSERASQIRIVPGLRYLLLVLTRDRCCREILAMMARLGHRTPPGAHDALLRLWLTLEVGLSAHRHSMLRCKSLWRDVDLYNAQFFFVKMWMLSNEPLHGARRVDLLQVCLGQRCGLLFLWEVLLRKRFTTTLEVMHAKAAYMTHARPTNLNIDRSKPVYGVPPSHVGVGHTEGWGLGFNHLLRPDELVCVESIRRGLDLHRHMRYMAVWGYYNWFTGDNIVPTEEEIYISDEERALSHMDTSHHWKKKHALKKRWQTLSPEMQRLVREADEDERVLAMAWAAERKLVREDTGSDDDVDVDVDIDIDGGVGTRRTPTLDDEITRGVIIQKPKPTLKPPTSTSDLADWAAFSSRALSGQPCKAADDEQLRAQAEYNYGADTVDWDWLAWISQELRDQNAQEVAAEGAQDDAEMADEEDGGASYDDGRTDVTGSEWTADDEGEDEETVPEDSGLGSLEGEDLQDFVDGFFQEVLQDVEMGGTDYYG